MYKIDKEKMFNVLTGIILSSSLVTLIGCASPNEKLSSVSNNNVKAEERNYNHTVLFFDGNTAILIPCDYFIGLEGGLVQIIPPDNYCEKFSDNYSIKFSSSDITIFDTNNNLSSYDQAFNFALSLTSEVYNYDDIINGEYNNIALGVNIEREMGITKKKDL